MGKASPKPPKLPQDERFKSFHISQRAYLSALSIHGRILKACEQADVHTSTVWHWRRNVPDFTEAEQYAKSIGDESLVEAAYKRAVEGIEIPIIKNGEVTRTYHQYSDKLLEVLLKGHRPDTYKERRELSGDPDRPIQIEIVSYRDGADHGDHQ